MKAFFPTEIWYAPGKPIPKLPVDLWERDIANIKELGFNTVRGWVDWASCEPRPGDFRFEDVDLIMRLAEKNNLKVVLQVYVEFSPDWLAQHYPDAKFVADSGHVISPQAAPGVCTDHPGVETDVKRFLTALANHVKDKPVFYGWDIWSEPHIVQWAWSPHLGPRMLAGSASFCYCRYTTQKFREWLKQKYKTVEALNEAWCRTFADWEMVEPPRLTVHPYVTDFVDWQLFSLDRLADILRWKTEAVKKAAPGAIVTSHAVSSCILRGPPPEPLYGFPDDWRMARQVDAWGTSFYPKHSGMEHWDPADAMAGIDAIRSASSASGKPFWIGEFQTGPGVTAFRVGEPVTPEDMQVWIWSILARGGKGLAFYHWYPMGMGIESTGFGMVNLDGSITDRARATGKIAKMINKYSDLLVDSRPAKAETAILYSELSYTMVARYVARWPEIITYPRDAFIGTYRALFERNIPVDFVHLDEVIEGKLEKYKLLYMPFAIMISRQACKRIREFIEDGGTVVSDARSGWNDETGRCGEAIPGFGLSEIFHCKERLIRGREKTNIRVVEADPAVPSLTVGDQLTGTVYEETLDVLPGGTVIAESPDGLPVIVVAEHGKGKTAFVGSFSGMAYERYRDSNTGRLLQGFVDWAGVRNPVEVSGIPKGHLIDTRVLEGDSFRVLIAINHGKETVEPSFGLRLPTGQYRAYNLVAEKEVTCKYEDGLLSLTKSLAPSEVWVVRITGRDV